MHFFECPCCSYNYTVKSHFIGDYVVKRKITELISFAQLAYTHG